MSFRKPLRRSQIERRRKVKPVNLLRYELVCGGSVKRFSDGREVCVISKGGYREYCRRLEAMLERQNFKCSLGGESLHPMDATFEHSAGRGMNSSRRDDRIEDDHGQPLNSAACWKHNTLKGSKRA